MIDANRFAIDFCIICWKTEIIICQQKYCVVVITLFLKPRNTFKINVEQCLVKVNVTQIVFIVCINYELFDNILSIL